MTIKQTANDIYHAVFEILDQQTDMDGLTAGKIASACERLAVKELKADDCPGPQYCGCEGDCVRCGPIPMIEEPTQ